MMTAKNIEAVEANYRFNREILKTTTGLGKTKTKRFVKTGVNALNS